MLIYCNDKRIFLSKKKESISLAEYEKNGSLTKNNLSPIISETKTRNDKKKVIAII